MRKPVADNSAHDARDVDAMEERSVKFIGGGESEKTKSEYVDYIIRMDPTTGALSTAAGGAEQKIDLRSSRTVSGVFTRIPKEQAPRPATRSPSPPLMRSRKRSDSRERSGRSHGGRRSRSRSRGRGSSPGRRGRSPATRRRSRSRERRRSRSRGRRRSRSPYAERRRMRSKSRSRERHRRDELQGRKFESAFYSICITCRHSKGVISETEQLRRERERIEQEKAALLAGGSAMTQQGGRMHRATGEGTHSSSMPDLPLPVRAGSALSRLGPKMSEAGPSRGGMSTSRRQGDGGRWGDDSERYMDNVMDSVLKAVDSDKDR